MQTPVALSKREEYWNLGLVHHITCWKLYQSLAFISLISLLLLSGYAKAICLQLRLLGLICIPYYYLKNIILKHIYIYILSEHGIIKITARECGRRHRSYSCKN